MKLASLGVAGFLISPPKPGATEPNQLILLEYLGAVASQPACSGSQSDSSRDSARRPSGRRSVKQLRLTLLACADARRSWLRLRLPCCLHERSRALRTSPPRTPTSRPTISSLRPACP